MANHAVVRTDRMFGTDNRAGLISVKYVVSTTETAIDNGNVLKVGALEGDSTNGYEREVFLGSTPAANDALKDIVLVASPEVMYDERLHNLSDFYNEAGKIARAYRLHDGDIFGVTKEALAFNTDEATDGKIGSVVELKADTKLNVKTGSATSGSTVVGKVIAFDVVGPYTYYVILVG